MSLSSVLPISTSSAGLLNNAPSSQKAGVRPISFLLDDPVTNSFEFLPLNIRPEELTRSEPSRMSVNQTLGDGTPAWVDSFGEGLPTIHISGHTGWRGTLGSGGVDGMAVFKLLHKICYTDFHAKRKLAVQKGIDPNTIKLVFVDALDSFSWVVVPMPNSFVLRRSRQRPLLMQYQISLQVVDTDADRVSSILSAYKSSIASKQSPGMASLLDSLQKLTDGANSIANFISGTIGAAAAAFLQMSANVLSVASAVIGSITGAIDTVIGSVLSVAKTIMMAGRNLMAAVTLVESLPAYAEYRMQQIMSAYSNTICLLTNVFTTVPSYSDYSGWYGSSNCSSTSGGTPISPLAAQNPFALLPLSPSTGAGSLIVSSQAALALQVNANADPVLQPATSPASVQQSMTIISSGVTAVTA